MNRSVSEKISNKMTILCHYVTLQKFEAIEVKLTNQFIAIFLADLFSFESFVEVSSSVSPTC